MKTISASKFKEQCLMPLDNLDAEGIIITKQGKPIARLVPAGSGCAELIGGMKGKNPGPRRYFFNRTGVEC